MTIRFPLKEEVEGGEGDRIEECYMVIKGLKIWASIRLQQAIP